MQDIETGRVIYLVVLLAVIGGWFLMQNRLNMNKTLQYAAVWAMIFIGGAAAVGLWEDISRDAGRNQISVTSQGAIVVPRARDGHYHLSLEVNETNIHFVVDTGATDIVLTREDALRAGIDVNNLAYRGRASTANGQVRTAFVRLDEVRLGDVVDHDIPAVVNEGEMQQSLLGMGYLQQWGRIEIANNELLLTR